MEKINLTQAEGIIVAGVENDGGKKVLLAFDYNGMQIGRAFSPKKAREVAQKLIQAVEAMEVRK